MGLTCCLADQYSDIRFPDTLYAQKLDGDSCWRWIGIYWNWYWTHRYLDDVQNKKAEEPKQRKSRKITFSSGMYPILFIQYKYTLFLPIKQTLRLKVVTD